MKTISFILLVLLVQLSAFAARLDIQGPPGSGQFGYAVTELPNGNVVITDPDFDQSSPPLSNVGAVYLYKRDGTLISTLTGSTPGDRIGSGGVVKLPNGHYLVCSPEWTNGQAANAGAWTWCNANTGIQGQVSATNSLVGSSTDDSLVPHITPVIVLPNGNYLVSLPYWDRDGLANVGALTWCDANTGRTGVIGPGNSLVGGSENDWVGFDIVVLTNGNFVVVSRQWSMSYFDHDLGAVTWVNGATGLIDEVSTKNSITGSTADDQVGTYVEPLANGNYIIGSPSFDNNGTVNVGSVTWCSGSSPSAGKVSAANSLLGAVANDGIGNVVALTNGNYVLSWNSATINGKAGAGAWLWFNGSVATVGTASTANSLHGTAAGDGWYAKVVPLANGNYVVVLPRWDNGAVTDAGAVSWCNGNGATTGTVSAGNALVGTTADDMVGAYEDFNNNLYTSVFALPNGNYVVSSMLWNNGAVGDAGAVTWGNGTVGTKGVVSSNNSLVGSAASDNVGKDIEVLTNGNYVVCSPSWHSGGNSVGAATWCSAASGRSGFISAANSLVGSTVGDGVGYHIYPLTNGNYVAVTPYWSNGAATDAGAVTWGNGATGSVGVVGAGNSLVGTHADDSVWQVTTLSNGNYVVHSSQWGDQNEGAVTWGSGTKGVKGAVSAANSLTGSQMNDHVGYFVRDLGDGRCLVQSPSWHNGANIQVGAGTMVDASGPITGTVAAGNSVVGNVVNGLTFTYSGIDVGYDTSTHQLAVGKPKENSVVLVNNDAVVTFATNSAMVGESAGKLDVVITRGGDLGGTATVKLSTLGGTATANADFAAINNQVVTFDPGVTTQTVPVKILSGNAANEPNESFSLLLGSPGTDTVLGAIGTMSITIVETNYAAAGAPYITTPAANSSSDLAAGATLSIAGTASAQAGASVNHVYVSFNGSAFADAAVDGSGNFSMTVTPIGGRNDIIVQSKDSMNNLSPCSHRSFVVRRELVVNKVGNGTLTTGYAPASFRTIGSSLGITATPAAGSLFNGWSVTGPSADISAEMLNQATLTFTMKQGMTLTANFAPNPFTPSVTGSYSGFITASSALPDRAPLGSNSGEDGTTPGVSTEGLFAVSVLANATFTGKLSIDGLVFPIAGSFTASGHARFGAARSSVLIIPRAGKPGLRLSMDIDFNGAINGTVSAVDYQQNVLAVSVFNSCRAGFSNSSTVPASLLNANNATATYNLALPALEMAGLNKHTYPQGDGIALLTLSKAGTVAGAGSLSDGTPFTFSTALSKDLVWRIFLPLYSKLGFVRGSAVFDPASVNDDLYAMSCWTWLKPVDVKQQYYPQGWPQMIGIGCVGSKFTKPAGQSVLRAPGGFDLTPVNLSGNATLTLSDGNLFTSLTKVLNVTAANAVQKLPVTDTSFTMSISTAGKVTGTFTHTDGTKPAYQAMILQKGANAGAYGYFLTAKPAVPNFLGESGGVSVVGQ